MSIEPLISALFDCQLFQGTHMITTRKGTVDDRFSLARIIINATNSAFAGRVPESSLSSLGAQESASNWQRSIQKNNKTELLLVAEIKALDVVGFVLAGRDPRDIVIGSDLVLDYTTEITSLQIEPAWQGVGIGKKLVQQAAANLKEKGHKSILVRVLADNPNIGFYEHLGAIRLGEQDYDWEGYQTKEFIYGWHDINLLIGEN
jgi:ribosomal protein S18 acetylase RimI-like enzyme